MQDAQTFLEIIRSRGERGLELKRVYRNLRNGRLFLQAYAKLYANQGALTPGTDPEDTVDGMSLKRIGRIVKALKEGTYGWKPVRRTYIPKRNGKLRPLGMPNWSDKMLQEVIRMVLNAYYEPQFSDASHGFRPGRGCHTALRSILFEWRGTKWFIEGDIKGCFDHIDHDRLLEVIGRKIKDQRFLKLLRAMLKAGYLENWRYQRTYSGAPQGGVVSPILTNILLNELDQYVEKELVPQYTKGCRRRRNPAYEKLTRQMTKAKWQGSVGEYQALKQQRRQLSCGDPNDPNYERLYYVRYADDFLLGYVGPKSKANEIKRRIKDFLATIGLTLSEEKTMVTHATRQRARFLGYDIHIAQSKERRGINGSPRMSVPREVAREWKTRHTRGGKSWQRAELLNRSDYDIVMTYNVEFQGLVNYYALAHDVSKKLYPVKWVWLQSLVKTLANKHKRGAAWVYQGYYRKSPQGVMGITVEIAREKRRPITAWFGAKPIRFDKWARSGDVKRQLLMRRSELVERLLAEKCELCGSTAGIEVHHIRKLKDVQKQSSRRRQRPPWAITMSILRRKTLVVCTPCHGAIHSGTYDGPRLK